MDNFNLQNNNNNNLPVQNFGSSLKSPQWSNPSQYLSSGKHTPVLLHGNSDIWHDSIITIKFNNNIPHTINLPHEIIYNGKKEEEFVLKSIRIKYYSS